MLDNENQIKIKKRLVRLFNNYFPYIIIFVFLILSILLISQHEFWSDEVHAWHIASESSSLSEVFRITRVAEGTPSLWHIILYFISHYITDNLEVMKVLHLIVSTLTAYLIIKFAPFNKIIRVMIIFGYFFFYEYSIISRNYALGVLLIILFCVLYKNKYKNILPLGITLFFLGQVNTLAFIISLGLFIILFIDIIKYSKNNRINKTIFLFFVALFLSGVSFFMWQLLPQINPGAFHSLPDKTDNFLDSFSIFRFLNQFSKKIIKAFIPIPRITLEFWNSSMIFDLLTQVRIRYRLILLSILILFPLFMIKKKIIFLYVFCEIFMIFVFFIYKDPIRLLGYIFILFISCLWISNINEEGNFLIRLKTSHIKRFQNIILSVLLIASLIASGIAFYYDYKYPFSNGKNVADYINKNFDEDEIFIIGYRDWAAGTVVGYLNRDIYYIQSGEFKKIVEEDKMKQLDLINYEEIILDVYRLRPETKEKKILIVVSPHKILDDEMKNLDIILMKEFENSILASENYYLYLLED